MWGPDTDEPILEDTGGKLDCTGTRFLHTDHEGSVIAQADCWGRRVAVNGYDEYGIPNATNQGRFGYTGQMWLPDIGMNDYKARIYSPTLGRFLQTDPIGYKDQINPMSQGTPMAMIGYGPFSTADQSLSLRLDVLTQAGCARPPTRRPCVRCKPGAPRAGPGARARARRRYVGTWKLDRLGRSLAHTPQPPSSELNATCIAGRAKSR